MKTWAQPLIRWMRKGSRWFPQRWRDAAFRRLVRVPGRRGDELCIQVAQTTDEFVQALRILHEAYRERGYDNPNATGVRLTPYHLVPTTTVVVAKVGERVVGTISVIKDSALGLPTDALHDLSRLRRYGERVAEGSSIAVVPEYRDRRLMFLLMKFLWEYLAQHAGVRHLVITVHPRHEDMYRAVLLMRRYEGKRRDTYDFVNIKGTQAITLTLDLKTAPRRFEQVYASCPPNANLYRFFLFDRRPELRFPDRSLVQANHSGVSVAVIREVLAQGLASPQVGHPGLAAALREIHGLDIDPPRGAQELAQREETLQRLQADPRWSEWWAVHMRAQLQVGQERLSQADCRVLSVRPDCVELGFRRGVQAPSSATLVLGVAGVHALAVQVQLRQPLNGLRLRYEVITSDPAWYDLAGAVIRRNQVGDTGWREGPRHSRHEFPDTAWRAPESLLSAFAAD